MNENRNTFHVLIRAYSAGKFRRTPVGDLPQGTATATLTATTRPAEPSPCGTHMLVLNLLTLSAALVGTDRWTRLAHRLPTSPATASSPMVTLYRDTNGWCPFCERVWLQLQAKGIPYEEVLINLQDKPQWYKDMVPTTLVMLHPCLPVHPTERQDVRRWNLAACGGSHD